MSEMIGHNCGVFTCIYADFLASNRPLTFFQMHIDRCRNLIALSMITEHSIGFNYHFRNLFDYLKQTLVSRRQCQGIITNRMVFDKNKIN